MLELCQTSGERSLQLDAYLGLGRTNQAADEPEQALTAHLNALELARELGQRPDEARALHGLAHANQTLGNTHQARDRWQQALHILTELDQPTTEDISIRDIEQHLAELDRTSSNTRHDRPHHAKPPK
jgi:tetratricopeptide (TPR) repeat protein